MTDYRGKYVSYNTFHTSFLSLLTYSPYHLLYMAESFHFIFLRFHHHHHHHPGGVLCFFLFFFFLPLCNSQHACMYILVYSTIGFSSTPPFTHTNKPNRKRKKRRRISPCRNSKFPPKKITTLQMTLLLSADFR